MLCRLGSHNELWSTNCRTEMSSVVVWIVRSWWSCHRCNIKPLHMCRPATAKFLNSFVYIFPDRSPSQWISITVRDKDNFQTEIHQQDTSCQQLILLRLTVYRVHLLQVKLYATNRHSPRIRLYHKTKCEHRPTDDNNLLTRGRQTPQTLLKKCPTATAADHPQQLVGSDRRKTSTCCTETCLSPLRTVVPNQ